MSFACSNGQEEITSSPRHISERRPSPGSSPQQGPDEDLEDNPLHEDNLGDFGLDKQGTPPQKPKRLLKLKLKAPLSPETQEKLHTLSRRLDNSPNLRELIEGTRKIAEQKWKTLIQYFDRDEDVPSYRELWSHTVWKKSDVVEYLLRICERYQHACRMSRIDGQEVDSKEVDVMVLPLVKDILGLGEIAEADRDSTIDITEWERPGTKEAMEIETLWVDWGEDEEEKEDEEDDEEDGDSQDEDEE